MDKKRERKRYLPKQGVDLDLFCTIKTHSVHIATMGGKVPFKIREQSVQRGIQLEILKQEDCTNAKVDVQRIEHRIQGLYNYIEEYNMADELEEIYRDVPSFSQLDKDKYSLPIRLYASTNIMYAKKGYYSYSYDERTDKFVLIASPEESKLNTSMPAIDKLIEPQLTEDNMPIEFSFMN